MNVMEGFKELQKIYAGRYWSFCMEIRVDRDVSPVVTWSVWNPFKSQLIKAGCLEQLIEALKLDAPKDHIEEILNVSNVALENLPQSNKSLTKLDIP